MGNIEFRVVTDLSGAQALWEDFSYKETIFDLWNMRTCYYNLDNFPLHFIIGSSDGQPVGLLPLQFNTDNNYLEFFGGIWMEDNKVYLKHGVSDEVVRLFYDQVKGPARLVGIHQLDAFSTQLPLDDYKYQLDLTNYKGYWDYINDKYEPETRHKFRKRMRHMEDHQIELLKDQPGDIELLFEYSKGIFGSESSFTDPKRECFYRALLSADIGAILYTFVVDGKKQAVCMTAHYKDIMYAINSGVNRAEVPDLNTYCSLTKIGEAIKMGCKTYDALMGSFGWKEPWHLHPTPFTKLRQELPEGIK